MSAPFDVGRFESLLKTDVLGRSFLFEASVGSTMDVARAAAGRGAASGTVAAADEQTAGRGRLGRGWVNPPAVNLASTLILRPEIEAVRVIAMIAPLAIVGAVEEVCGRSALPLGRDLSAVGPLTLDLPAVGPLTLDLPAVDIKWPNDVQVGGKKLAGVLIETDLTDGARPLVLVGAGINVNFDPREHEELREIATSVLAEVGREVSREEILAAYLGQFEELLGLPMGEVRERWRARLVTLGQAVTASWAGGGVEGTAEEVDGDGALLVRTEAGALVRVEAGDVTLRRG